MHLLASLVTGWRRAAARSQGHWESEAVCMRVPLRAQKHGHKLPLTPHITQKDPGRKPDAAILRLVLPLVTSRAARKARKVFLEVPGSVPARAPCRGASLQHPRAHPGHCGNVGLDAGTQGIVFESVGVHPHGAS